MSNYLRKLNTPLMWSINHLDFPFQILDIHPKMKYASIRFLVVPMLDDISHTVLSFSSSVCGDHPASCKACFADDMAYLVNSAVVLSSPLSNHSEAVKPPSLSGPSLTAAPILTGSSLNPGRSFKDTIPHLLLIMFSHTVFTPVPSGVTRPRPVTTTRLITEVYAMSAFVLKIPWVRWRPSVNSHGHVLRPYQHFHYSFSLF
jgi:hypothetical protein